MAVNRDRRRVFLVALTQRTVFLWFRIDYSGDTAHNCRIAWDVSVFIFHRFAKFRFGVSITIVVVYTYIVIV